MSFANGTAKYFYQENKKYKRIEVSATITFKGCSQQIVALAHGKDHDEARERVTRALKREAKSHARSCRSGANHS